MQHTATGSWLSAEHLAAACAVLVYQCRRDRRRAQRKEVVRLARKQKYRPWQIPYKEARRRVEASRFARYWWAEQENVGYRILLQARVTEGDIFVSATDYRQIYSFYEASLRGKLEKIPEKWD